MKQKIEMTAKCQRDGYRTTITAEIDYTRNAAADSDTEKFKNNSYNVLFNALVELGYNCQEIIIKK